MKKVSQALNNYLTIHHFTYDQGAKNLKLSKSTLYAYAKEKRNPTLKSLSKIANALNVNLSTLLDVSLIEEQELNFLNYLREEPLIHKLLMNLPKEKIQELKKCLLQNNNTK